MSAAHVSVVIPCYNYGRFLADAIESVLAQRDADVELIVVDDGSTDDTPAVAAAYPVVRYLHHDNAGESVARNLGAAEAGGEFILFLDADDELTPEALATSARRLREEPDCAFAYGHQRFLDADGSELPRDAEREQMFQTCLGDIDPYAYMLRKNYPLRAPGAVLYRSALFTRSGGFTRELRGTADLDLNLRIAREHRVCCNDRFVLSTRLHDGNMTRNARLMLRAAVEAQRRQRPFIERHARYQADFREGLRLARSYWGGHLAQEILADTRAGRLGAAVRGVWTFGCFARGAGAAAAVRLILAKVRRRRKS